MKNILFIITLGLLASCSSPTIVKKDSLPIEVLSLKEVNKYDTILTIQTEKQIHFFSAKKEYMGTCNTTSFDTLSLVFILIGMVLLAIMLILND